jgi:non-ribosomal peptide synthetase-like protein
VPLVPPRTRLEGRLAAVWADVFGEPAVSVIDDFFLDLGGHSLLAARMTSELRADPELRHATVGDVYKHPTIEQLARHLAEGKPESAAAKPVHPGIPRRRHFLCGLAQVFALYPLLGLVSVQWLAPYFVYVELISDGWDIADAVAAALLSLSVVYPALLVVGVAAKWLLLGRVKPGKYPLWGWFYLRWWAARAVISFVPTAYLVGTPLFGWYARRLGANVGRNVYLGSDELFPYDTLTVGGDSCVGADVGLRGYTVEGGYLHVGNVTVGRGCVIANRSVMQQGSEVGDGAKLDELSLLRTGEVIPARERWAGSPAKPVRSTSPLGGEGLGVKGESFIARESSTPHPQPFSPKGRGGKEEESSSYLKERPSRRRRLLYPALYALGFFLLPLFAICAFLPGVIAINRLGQLTDGYEYLLAAPLVAVSFVVLFALEVAAAKWLLLGRVKAGTYSRHGFFHLRKWFVDRLAELSLDVTGTLYATIYLNPWYRLLGVKVGRMAEVSTACSVTHDLLTLGDQSFIADSVTVGGARVEGDTVTLGPVRIGPKAFAGNGAHLPPGRTLGDDALIGCLSLLPADADRPGSAWVGSPAFYLPQRQASAAFPEEAISRPPLRLWLARGAIEFARVTLPATVLVVLTSLLITATDRLLEDFSLAEVVLMFPLLYGVAAAAASLFVVALKWVVVGQWVPTERPLWSHFVWRTELISGVREHLADVFLLGLLRGTPFIAWYFRLLGAKIGNRVYLDTTDLCEYDLTAVGSEAELNDECTLQTHLFEDRVMKVSRVSVGPRAMVGAWTLVLYDTTIGPGAAIEGLSLLMKGEVLPDGTRWVGIPAGRAS